MFAALVTISDIKDTQIDRIRLVCKDTLLQTEDNLLEALNLCGSLYDIAEKYKQVCSFFINLIVVHLRILQNTLLQKSTQVRKEVYETFIDDICDKCKEIDIRFSQKEEELQQFYTDLETKLLDPKLHINLSQ